MNDQDTTAINRYLLGQLPREEADRIEARLLSEAGLFELAESVEDEVIDRYVRGELAPEERRRFERRLLSSERIGERVTFARALAAHGSRRDALSDAEAGQVPIRIDRGTNVVPLFRPAAARLAWAATLVVAVLGAWLAIQVVRLDDRTEELEAARTAALERAEEATAVARDLESVAESAHLRETEAVELERELAEAKARLAELEIAALPTDAGRGERRVRRPGDYGEESATATLFLALATRSGAGAEVLRIEDEEWVELQLDLGGRKPAETIAASVTRGGQAVFSQEGIKVRSLGGESAAVLILPAERLQPGPGYRVVLTTAGPEPPLGSYEFSVDR